MWPHYLIDICWDRALLYARHGRLDDALGSVEEIRGMLQTAIYNREKKTLRPNDLYNLACVFCQLGKKDEALKTLRRAWETGFQDPGWARRDPDLAILHGDPEFERLYPAS